MTIEVKVIADSISLNETKRITTLQLRYPRFIHAEFMTHRQFSRNASSSRAIPVKRLIEDIVRDTAMPISWGSNKPGMQAGEECNNEIIWEHIDGSEDTFNRYTKEQAWMAARDRAIASAESFNNAGYHKQIVNRLLEPFSHINVVVTSTEWSNFFTLRIHAAAQPEIKLLAEKMRDAIANSSPEKKIYGQWHLPYVTTDEMHKLKEYLEATDKHTKYETIISAIKCSVARCARVSYLTYEGKSPNIEDDLKLYDRLVGEQPIHASPAEHQATPGYRGLAPSYAAPGHAPELWGNFQGWIQYRKTLKGECQ